MKFFLFIFLIIVAFVIVFILSFIGKVANLFRGNHRYQAKQRDYTDDQNSTTNTSKYISKEEGKYVDFEEIKEDN